MWGKPAAAAAGVTLQQPEARRVFSRGSCPWLPGCWQWRAAQAPGRGGVESDLCSHTGFLVVAAAALAFHARLWGPLVPVSGARLGGALNPLSSRTRKQRGKKNLLPVRQLQTFSRTPCRLAVASGCVHAANPSPLPGV